jgi:hypothetical protein
MIRAETCLNLTLMPLDELPSVAEPWHMAGREAPVFLDEHGRRHRLLRPLAVVVVTLAASWLVALVLGASGFAGLPRVMPVPGAVVPAGSPLRAFLHAPSESADRPAIAVAEARDQPALLHRHTTVADIDVRRHL